MAQLGKAGGHRPYLHFAKESVWSTPVTPDIYLPYDSYGVIAAPAYYVANRFTGVRQRKSDNEIHQIPVGGTIACDLLGFQFNSLAAGLMSIAQHLIDPAFSGPASETLDSLTFNLFDPNEGTGTSGKLHDGCRINSLTLSGDEGSAPIKLSLDVFAAAEAVAAEVALPAASRRRAFLFRDSVFSFGGTTTPLKSFGFTLENNLIRKYNNSLLVSGIYAGDRNTSLTFALDKDSDTYDLLRRVTDFSDRTAQIVLKGDHEGTGATGTFTTLTMDFDVTQFAGATDDTARNDLMGQSLSYAVLKADTSANDVDLTWSDT